MRFGAMWLDSARPRFGRPALSVELLYTDSGAAGMDELADRVDPLVNGDDVAVLIRVDVSKDLTIPANDDFVGKFDYTHFIRKVAEHPVLGRASGIIVGNEPNLKSPGNGDRSFAADWYMKVHSGVNADPSDEADARTQLRQAGYAGDVLIAAVAPWSDAGDGLLESYPTPVGATGTMHWHRYLSTLYWFAFNQSRLTRAEVKGAVHTYSNVLLCQSLGLDPAREPSFRNQLRVANFKNCHYGIRVYEEFLQQMVAQAGGAGVPHYVTEWNSFVGGTRGDLDDPAWPCNNYPSGLLANAVAYMARHPHLLGFGVFVDRDPSGGNPIWRACAAKGHLEPVDMSDDQRERLLAWDQEMDALYAQGWEPAATRTRVG